MRIRHVCSVALLLAPVAVGAQPAKLWPKQYADSLKPRPSGVRLEIVVTETPVPATTLDEYIRKVNAGARGPASVRTAGSSAWFIGWPSRTESRLTECRFSGLDVSMRYTIDVAMLAGPLASDTAAQRWWTERTDSIHASHLHRLRLIRDGAKAIQQKVRNMTDSNCDELRYRADAAAREQLKTLQEQMTAAGAPVGIIDDGRRARPD